VRFFQGVSAVRKQLATADGLVGYTLRAKPLARDYWTLSVWKTTRAPGLHAHVPSHPVDDLAQAVHGPTKFVTGRYSRPTADPAWQILEHLRTADESVNCRFMFILLHFAR
jgi:hypothetical protein